MTSNSFFPTTEAAQIIWLNHYNFKLPVNGPECGINNQELKATSADLLYYIWLLEQWHPAMRRDAKEATAYKQLMISGSGNDIINYPQASVFTAPPPAVIPGIQKRLFNQIVRIKASLKYTEVIGHDLGIIGSVNTVEYPIPDYTLTLEQGDAGPRVRFDFKKHGHDGICIETNSNGGDWSFLAINTVKPYYDERPVVDGGSYETREYRMRWWDKSQAHGEWSAVQRIVLGK